MWPSPSGKNGLQRQKEFKMAGKRNWIRTGLSIAQALVITCFVTVLIFLLSLSHLPQRKDVGEKTEADKWSSEASNRALLMTGASSAQPQKWKVLKTPDQSPFKRTILIHLKPLAGDGVSATELEPRVFYVSGLHTFFTEFQKLRKGDVISLRFVAISDNSHWEEEISYLAPDTEAVRDYISSICPF